jgi:acyl carrier protein
VTGRPEISARVRDLLAQVLGVPDGEVGPGFTADAVPSWSSLNHLMLISQLEQEFGVVFTNQEIRQLTSYQAIVDLLDQRVAEA